MYKVINLYRMHILPLSEFRANASAMLDLVERGETVRIMRHGRAVADLVPAQAGEPEDADSVPSWKRPFDPVKLPRGASLSQAVVDERDEAAW
jgi:prevent-host-death family protein